MPLQKCSSNNKQGWRWGDKGKCYTGPGAKKKAIKQGVAIEGPEKFGAKATDEEIELAYQTDLLLITKMQIKKGDISDKLDGKDGN